MAVTTTRRASTRTGFDIVDPVPVPVPLDLGQHRPRPFRRTRRSCLEAVRGDELRHRLKGRAVVVQVDEVHVDVVVEHDPDGRDIDRLIPAQGEDLGLGDQIAVVIESLRGPQVRSTVGTLVAVDDPLRAVRRGVPTDGQRDAPAAELPGVPVEDRLVLLFGDVVVEHLVGRVLRGQDEEAVGVALGEEQADVRVGTDDKHRVLLDIRRPSEADGGRHAHPGGDLHSSIEEVLDRDGVLALASAPQFDAEGRVACGIDDQGDLVE